MPVESHVLKCNRGVQAAISSKFLLYLLALSIYISSFSTTVKCSPTLPYLTTNNIKHLPSIQQPAQFNNGRPSHIMDRILFPSHRRPSKHQVQKLPQQQHLPHIIRHDDNDDNDNDEDDDDVLTSDTFKNGVATIEPQVDATVSTKKTFPISAIIGISVGGGLLLVLIIVLTVVCLKRDNSDSEEQYETFSEWRSDRKFHSLDVRRTRLGSRVASKVGSSSSKRNGGNG